jgi:hypothetical protein
MAVHSPVHILVVVLGSAGFLSRQQRLYRNVEFLHAVGVAELMVIVRRRPVDGVLIETLWLEADEVVALEELSRYPSLPAVWYGALPGDLAPTLVDIARWSNPKLVLRVCKYTDLPALNEQANSRTVVPHVLLLLPPAWWVEGVAGAVPGLNSASSSRSR